MASDKGFAIAPEAEKTCNLLDCLLHQGLLTLPRKTAFRISLIGHRSNVFPYPYRLPISCLEVFLEYQHNH